MKKIWSIPITAVTALLLLMCSFPTLLAAKGQLRAGAARVNITPPADARFPMGAYGASRTTGHTGIHDSLYFRAIVVDDGQTQAAIVVGDIGLVSHSMWELVIPRIIAATGIPQTHIMLAATHTHSGTSLGGYSGTSTVNGDIAKAKQHQQYITDVHEKISQVTLEAQARLQPARVGVGQGRSSVNMNRRARIANGGWWLGFNPDGPSDKTVHVIKFETLRGEPIAILSNYGVHATIMGGQNQLISADIAGSTARFVEQHYGDRLVAPWTSGAAGDQAPIYTDEATFDDRIGPVSVLGQILGEEVIRVAGSIRTSSRGRIRAAQTVATCPGKKNPPGPRFRPDQSYQFLDGDPVDIRLSVLMIGNIAITGVSGEPLTMISQRLQQLSPFKETLMVTLCNGFSGYICDDDAYDQVSFEIVKTRLKRGFAEDAVVNGLLDLMEGL
jgi:neutral ceramidase